MDDSPKSTLFFSAEDSHLFFILSMRYATASTDDWYDSFSGVVYGVSLSPSMKSVATFGKRGGSVTAIAIGPLASFSPP